MQENSRRLAERVPFRAPAEVFGLGGIVKAEIRDLSRTGLRVRLAAAVFPVPPEDLLRAAELLQQIIGRTPTVRLHPDKLGSLISRKARVTRVMIPSDADGAVDVGCSFDQPLTGNETAMLGVPLLPERGRADAALPRADTFAPATREVTQVSTAGVHAHPAREETPATSAPTEPAPVEPEPVPIDLEPALADPIHAEQPAPALAGESIFRPVRYRAYLAGRGESMQCEAEAVSTESIVVRMKRALLQQNGADLDMIKIVSGLASRFGAEVRLRVADGAKHLWNGTAHIGGVDLPDDRPEIVRVCFTFVRGLNTSERARLGL